VLFLLSAIAATAAFFSKASRTAALLLVPHLPWTGFASVFGLLSGAVVYFAADRTVSVGRSTGSARRGSSRAAPAPPSP
jgi:hypothetical protein